MPATQYSVTINPAPGRGELAVLFAGSERTEPDHRVGPQVLDYHLLHLVTAGRGEFACRDRHYTLEPGDAFFIFPGELARYGSDEQDPWTYHWVGFRGTLADQLLSGCGISAAAPIGRFAEPDRALGFLMALQRELAEPHAGVDLAAGAYLRLIFASLASHTGRTPEPHAEDGAQLIVNQAVRWLTLQASKPVSIDRMARSLGYHRTYLSKIFKQQTGYSPQQYLLKIRMERAKKLLGERLTIEQIASSVGYQDALHFSKQFKKWFGQAPTEARARLQSNPDEQFSCR